MYFTTGKEASGLYLLSWLHGVNLDPETLVVIGDGSPIGYPNIEYEVTEQEWLPFKAVNRDRGDSLLGITWIPDAPEGWYGEKQRRSK